MPWVVVNDFETRQEGPSYSWKTAEAMRQQYPGVKLYWIMGSDQWEALPAWAHPERLAACCEFIVFGRDAVPAPRDGYLMHPLADSHPASATQIRQDLASGVSSHPWLHPDVSAWINRQRLYRS